MAFDFWGYLLGYPEKVRREFSGGVSDAAQTGRPFVTAPGVSRMLSSPFTPALEDASKQAASLLVPYWNRQSERHNKAMENIFGKVGVDFDESRSIFQPLENEDRVAQGILALGGIASLRPPKNFSRWTDYFRKNPAKKGDYNTHESAEIKTQLIRELKEENPNAILSKKEGGLGGVAGIIRHLKGLIGEGGLETIVKDVWKGGVFSAAARKFPLSNTQIQKVIEARKTLGEDGRPITYDTLADNFGVNRKTISQVLQQKFVNEFYSKNNLGSAPNMAQFNINTPLTTDEIVALLRAGRPKQKVNKYSSITKDEFLALPKEKRERLTRQASKTKSPINAPLSNQTKRFKSYIDRAAGEDVNRLKGKVGGRKKSLSIVDIVTNPEVRKLFPKAFKELSSGGVLFRKPSDVTAENMFALNTAINKYYGGFLEGSTGHSARTSLTFHKAREFAAQGAGYSSGTSPGPHARNLAKVWYSNLNPAQRAEFEAMWDWQQRLNNVILRDQKGRISKAHQRVLHHPQWLSKGGLTSYEQDYNWEMLPQWKHDKVHADKILSDRRKRDESIRKFTLMNLMEDPEYVMKSWEGTAW